MSILAAKTRLERGDIRTGARMLLALATAEAAALLDGLPADGPHGAFLAERLRFGPPETWLGWKAGTGRVAVKLFPANQPMPSAMAQLAAFRHPGVAPMLAWGPGWIMQGWIDGPSLAGSGKAFGSARLAAAMAAGDAHVAHALNAIRETIAALHAAGLAHGDLTPANIVLAENGPVLIDWGERTAGTPGWRPDGPHSVTERDHFAIEKLRRYLLPAGSQ